MEDAASTDQQSKTHDKTLALTSGMQEPTTTMPAEVAQSASDERALATTTPMQEVTIDELRVKSYDTILEARVYRKWVVVTYQIMEKMTETGFCCILIDREVCNHSCNINKPY